MLDGVRTSSDLLSDLYITNLRFIISISRGSGDPIDSKLQKPSFLVYVWRIHYLIALALLMLFWIKSTFRAKNAIVKDQIHHTKQLQLLLLNLNNYVNENEFEKVKKRAPVKLCLDRKGENKKKPWYNKWSYKDVAKLYHLLRLPSYS